MPESSTSQPQTNISSSTLASVPGPTHSESSPKQTNEPKRRARNRKTSNVQNNARSAGLNVSDANAVSPNVGDTGVKRGKPRRRGRGPGRIAETKDENNRASSSEPQIAESSEARKNGRGGGRLPAGRRNGSRKNQMNTQLTGKQEGHEGATEAAVESSRARGPKEDTLTNRLIDSLRTPPYVDCPICFNAIHPAQPIWSCSPSTSSNRANDDESGDSQYCYTPFHLKCIKSWASKSVKDMQDAYRTRGETGKEGDWRCPGCQRKRLQVPPSYLCFCGSTPDPRPPRLATPHSCGNPCSRRRTCSHSCPLLCHPGPCPPCQVTIQLLCHCTRQTKSFRCGEILPGAGISCGRVCDRILNCGRHRCVSPCHPGNCSDCTVTNEARCYCGKNRREIRCFDEREMHSSKINDDGVLEEWDGKFSCENPCGQLFDCGIHKCEEPCHTPSTKAPRCPKSPLLVTHCPCGKKTLSELENGHRSKCTDPIATCGSICKKALKGCDHVCSKPCHIGPCPPCSISLILPCRCGSTTRAVPCHESQAKNESEETQILCDKPCTALRACGRHQCNRACCPLAVLAGVGGARGKGKKRQAQQDTADIGEESHWHECDLICGKPLSCGNHRCEERDHRGPCPPCLRSSFEEMVCVCGRTILEPPIPCGTRINCSYSCSRPPLPCGHPKSPHACHEDPTPCPPCPFLASKLCACGKTSVKNVRCSQEKVSCGSTCGKLLDCGYHHCERSCHGDECGPCSSVCGKPRKLCLPAHHGCNTPCHAPAACSEDEPCQAQITLQCSCGRIQQSALCGRSNFNPDGRQTTTLKCTNECAVAKRNARLAEALGISQEVRDRNGERNATYSNELATFAKANVKFCTTVEKTFSDFVTTERKLQVLPHMHDARRKFVTELASIYRIDTQMVDQEPLRSVQLIRRIDTRIPKPLLSASLSSGTPNFGKLVTNPTLRSSSPIASSSAPTTRPGSAASNANTISSGATASSTNHRGWTAVVASNATQNRNPVNSVSAWDASSPGGAAGSSSTIEKAPSRLVPLGKVTPSAMNTPEPDAQHDVPENWENDDN